MIPLIIQLISGAVGGNIAGALLKNLNLGPIGNSIAGIVGGGWAAIEHGDASLPNTSRSQERASALGRSGYPGQEANA